MLVWSHLIDFLKEVLVRYPHVKDAIPENKILEQVIVRYLADMPKTKSLYHQGGHTKNGGLSGVGRGGDSGDEREDVLAGGGGAALAVSQNQPHRRHVLQVWLTLILS